MNLGKYPEKHIVNHKVVTNKSIRAATGSCGCTSLDFDDNEFEFNWKLPTIPFQVQGDMRAAMSIDIIYKDNSKEIFHFNATVTK
jgi:hypothetical protein